MTDNRRILIVDDDQDTLANLSDILSDLGFETETAADATTALRIFESADAEHPCPIDLCLLDFKMPGMDGAELIQRIHSRVPGMTAIMITAYAGDDGVQRALDAGTWRVLRKPVDIPVLIGMINEAVA